MPDQGDCRCSLARAKWLFKILVCRQNPSSSCHLVDSLVGALPSTLLAVVAKSCRKKLSRYRGRERVLAEPIGSTTKAGGLRIWVLTKRKVATTCIYIYTFIMISLLFLHFLVVAKLSQSCRILLRLSKSFSNPGFSCIAFPNITFPLPKMRQLLRQLSATTFTPDLPFGP